MADKDLSEDILGDVDLYTYNSDDSWLFSAGDSDTENHPSYDYSPVKVCTF